MALHQSVPGRALASDLGFVRVLLIVVAFVAVLLVVTAVLGVHRPAPSYDITPDPAGFAIPF